MQHELNKYGFISPIVWSFLTDDYVFVSSVCKDWYAKCRAFHPEGWTHPRAIQSLEQNKFFLTLHPEWASQLPLWAARNGNVKVLHLARDCKLPLTDTLYVEAAQRGNMEVIRLLYSWKVRIESRSHIQQILIERGYITEFKNFICLTHHIDRERVEYTCARLNRKDLLNWLNRRARRVPFRNDAVAGAIIGGNIPLFKWLTIEYAVPLEARNLMHAIEGHNIEIASHILSTIEVEIKGDDKYLQSALRRRSPTILDILSWLHARDMNERTEQVLREAFHHQPYHVIQWLEQYNYPYSKGLYISAISSARNGYNCADVLSKLDMIRARGIPLPPFSKLFEASVKTKFLGLLQWLESEVGAATIAREGENGRLLVQVAQHLTPAIVEWCHDRWHWPLASELLEATRAQQRTHYAVLEKMKHLS